MSTSSMSIGELRARDSIGSMLIQMLRQDDDPRAAAAIEVLQAQQREINEIIEAREGKPPPIVITCKPAVLKARALR